jgi:hypothetical protein
MRRRDIERLLLLDGVVTGCATEIGLEGEILASFLTGGQMKNGRM